MNFTNLSKKWLFQCSLSSLPMRELREVGPASNYLSAAHTQAHFLTAFYQSTSSDSNSYEQWLSDGAKDTAQRANTQWKHLLESYEDPGLDPAIDEELQAFIAKRKESMPDQDYY